MDKPTSLTDRSIISYHGVKSVWHKFQLLSHQSDFSWEKINWKKVTERIQLQRNSIYAKTKVAHETKELADYENLVAQQKIMISSFDNLLLSVRRVSQINQGKNTPGIDKLVLKTDRDRYAMVLLIHHRINIYKWKPLPVNRIYIPKPNGKMRPLGIPSIVDRTIQAIIKNALEPEHEFKADIGSFGFRPGLSTHDAIEKIFKTLTTINYTLPRKCWILDADIKGCFDNINHQYLMGKIQEFPARFLIERWLKAGYMEKSVFYDTDSGTPQGGIISPLLANIALDGLERDLDIKYKVRKSNTSSSGTRVVLDDYRPKAIKHPLRSFVRYADDFLVLCETENDCLESKKHLEGCLGERGLSFAPEKVNITNIVAGFEFLGKHYRSFYGPINVRGNRKKTIMGYKLLITPSKKNRKKHTDKLKSVFSEHYGKQVFQLIKKINPIISGWANYHKTCTSKSTFSWMDKYLYVLQKRYGRRTHPNKSNGWINNKYFGRLNPNRMDNWVFGDKEGKSKNKKNQDQIFYMLKHRWTGIQRHDIVPNAYSRDDPSKRSFWSSRIRRGVGVSFVGRQMKKIAMKTSFLCPICFDALHNGEHLETHHIIPKRLAGPDTESNLVILHSMCHKSIRKSDAMPETAQLIRDNIKLIKKKS